jgi:ankyrin repeat protein
LILNGADIHELDFEGRNAVQLANILGKQRLYDFLAGIERETERLLEFIDNDDVVGVSNSLHRGASLGMTDTRLDTPLHRAAESGVSDVGLLLVHHGANIEARNYLGETALMTATLREQPEFAKMLIESGANVNALDERRRTPLDIAESKDNQSMMALLAKKKSRHGAAASVEFDFEAAEGGLDSAKQ